MADADVAAAAAAAPVSLRWGRKLAERESVWASLVEAGLAWQPDPARQAGECPLLALSSLSEWTAEHLKDAALHVLRVEAALRDAGWTLGSVASHWVQFLGCRPVWISQTALRPRTGTDWPGRQGFQDELLTPLLERSGRGRLERRWPAAVRRAAEWMTGRGSRDRNDPAALMESVEKLEPRRRWSPWRNSLRPLEPAGPAAILAREEAARRGARLIYEWRGRQPAAAPLRPWPGAAWVRFHEDDEEAAADYLEMRALGACALPLWNSKGDPMAACPRRAPADLLIAAGRGNVPQSGPELARFTQVIRRMATAALVEYTGAGDRGGWDLFLGTMSAAFRVVQVTDTGGGRRLCLLERE